VSKKRDARSPVRFADAFVVEYQRTAIAGRPRRIKTVILINWNVIPARHVAAPVVVAANTVGIGRIDRSMRFSHIRYPPSFALPKRFQGAVLQEDRLKLCQNRFAQFASVRAAPEIANHNRGRDCDGDDDGMRSGFSEVAWLNRLSLGKR